MPPHGCCYAWARIQRESTGWSQHNSDAAWEQNLFKRTAVDVTTKMMSYPSKNFSTMFELRPPQRSSRVWAKTFGESITDAAARRRSWIRAIWYKNIGNYVDEAKNVVAESETGSFRFMTNKRHEDSPTTNENFGTGDGHKQFNTLTRLRIKLAIWGAAWQRTLGFWFSWYLQWKTFTVRVIVILSYLLEN